MVAGKFVVKFHKSKQQITRSSRIHKVRVQYKPSVTISH